MVAEIRIYVEGGAKGHHRQASLRQGFAQFFERGGIPVRQPSGRLRVISCGSRYETFRDFRRALETHPQAFNILLVDAERTVSRSPQRQLVEIDGWDDSDLEENQCHLMVQLMEAWLIADPNALARFFGPDFRAGALPRTTNVEEIEKDRLMKALKSATRTTRPGPYHKTEHGPRLLALVDPTKVRKAAPHCDRLFQTIEGIS